MSRTVIVYGPPGCGKTRNAEALREAFGCKGILDGWVPHRPMWPGRLHLTNVRPEDGQIVDGVMIVAFKDAIKRVRR